MRNLINKYKTFIKYIFSAGISFFIDLILFTILSNILKLAIGSYAIIIGTIIARIISSLINYHLNRNKVFSNGKNGKGMDKTTFIKYVALVIIQMFLSSFSVFTLYNLTKINETLIKIPVEGILFLINYFVQKLFIFTDKKIKLPKKMHKYIIIILGIISSFAFLVELNLTKIVIMPRHDTDFMLYLIFGCFFITFYKKFLFEKNKYLSFKVLSVIFTALLILGYSYDTIDSAKLVFSKPIFILISIIKFIGIYPFINCVLNLIYEKWTNYKDTKLKENKVIKFFDNHPFLFSVIVIIICYLPYIIAFYPAIMGYDPANQIKEVMGIHTRYMDSVVLIDPNVTITNFNPVLHTLLLGNCFKLGVNIGNVNFGLFLYSIVQLVFMISTLAYSISFLKKEGISNKICLIILLIFSLVPVFPLYSLSTNKDTFFSLIFLLFVLKVYSLIKHQFNLKEMIILSVVGIFMFLLRNNGIYTVFLTLPFCFIALKEKRKMIGISMVIIFAMYMGYNNIILPYFKITPTSVREVLSIPFQQTAALIQEDEKVLTAEDRKIIGNILDYDTIKAQYDPELSDKVKNTFNRYYKDEDLTAYFNVWFKHLLKRPSIYVDATINNIYGYFYPNTSRWYLYYSYNTKLEEAGFDYHYNSLSWLRNILSGWGNAYQYTPIISAFVNIGFIVWVYLYLVTMLIVSKNKKYILLLLPALSLILVCIASPANAYFRYALPYITSLPATLALLLKNKKDFSN